MKTSRITLALGLAACVSGLTSCAGDQGPVYEAGTPVKVGLICLHGTSSTYDANFINSMAVAAKNLGARVSGVPLIRTDVLETEDCYTAARDLVKEGCNVIFADSFGHEPFMLSAAKEFTNVTFCHATGTKAKISSVANYHNAFASIYEGRYLAGYAAGLKLSRMVKDGQLKTNNYDANGNIKLGYVGAYPYAEVVSGYTAWYLGVKEVVNNVVMDVTYTREWYYYNGEAQGANTLADRGAALISQHADSMGAPGTCEELGIPNVTYNIPTATDCPKTYVAFSKIDWAPYYENVINSMYEGKAIEGEKNNNWTGTLATGSVAYDCASAEDKLVLDVIKAELEAKTRRVFDCSKFTKGGEHLTSYLADVDDYGDYAPETEVIKTEGGITYFDESSFRSAPYFDVRIDGITELNAD